jgi:transcriptional regulator with XRE-family HTH domain
MTAMTAARVCEFLQLRRLMLGYTYQKTADLANLSLITVKRYLTNKVKDPSFLIIQSLTHTLVCDSKGTSQPCPIHLFPNEIEQATAACKEAQDALAQKEKEFERDYHNEQAKTVFLKEQLLFAEEQLKMKDQQLSERTSYMKLKDRYIAALAIALGVFACAVIALLLADLMNPDLGFFWRTTGL